MRQLTISQAADRARAGEIIAYPTEAVYGLGCDPFSEPAVDALLTLKRRSVDQGLLLIGHSLTQFEAMLMPLSDADWQPALATWPGPTTWVVPCRNSVPDWIRGRHSGLAIRITDHPVCRALCEAFGGPLVSTSANPTGSPPARTAAAVADYFPTGIAGTVDGALGGLSRPTEIRRLIGGQTIRSGNG